MDSMNTANNLFLICGDEDYLREQQKNKLLSELNCEGSINFNVFTDDNLDIDEISSLMRTVPFAGKHRTLLIEGSGWFTGKVQSEMPETFAEIPDTCIVIFCEKNADKSNELYKLVQKNGEVRRFDSAESMQGKAKTAGKTEIRDWAKEQLRAAGRRIDSRTLFELTELTGYDMQNLSTELEKLICYTLDKPAGYAVSRDDVNAICSKTLSDRIFDMIDHKFKGRIPQAMNVLEELFALKIPAMRILFVIVMQYQRALGVRECMQAGLSDAEIMSKTGIKDWQLRRVREQVSNITAAELRQRLEACADTEYRIKTGDMTDRLGIELLMIR